jgi:hypothetical protein
MATILVSTDFMEEILHENNTEITMRDSDYYCGQRLRIVERTERGLGRECYRIVKSTHWNNEAQSGFMIIAKLKNPINHGNP